MSGPSVTLVALPLGNIEDLSPRARQALESATRIFCEDTRKIRELAIRAECTISAQLTAMPGDRERDYDWATEVDKAHDAERWVLVSDAGTPVVNDPGRSLLDYAHKKNLSVYAIPGPSAPVLAWQWSGGFGLPFGFFGFAPKTHNDEAKALDDFFALATKVSTFCFFDTKHQVLNTLRYLVKKGWGAAPLKIAREMTKTHEELLQSSVEEALSTLESRSMAGQPMGELTLLLRAPLDENPMNETTALEDLIAIRSLPPKAAAKIAAKLSGKSVAECYQAMIDAKDSRP